MDDTDTVAREDDFAVTAETNDADDEVGDDVELGGPVLLLMVSVPIEGAKGIPAPLGTPNSKS